MELPVLFWPVYKDLPAKLCRELLRVPTTGGLTLREALILHAVLSAETPPAIGEIAMLVDAPQPSVSRCLQRLERLGFIQRVPGRRNRQHITPTMKAEELLVEQCIDVSSI